MSVRNRFHLSVYEPLPVTGVAYQTDINPEITQLSFSTGTGGWNGLTVGIQDPARPTFGGLPEPVDLPYYAHVVLEIGGVRVWEGCLLRRHRVGGELVGFECVGYGIAAVSDDWYQSANASPATVGVILRDVISQAAPLLAIASDPDLFVDSGVLSTYDHFDGMFPAQAIQEISTIGGPTSGSSDDSVPYDWAVWEDRVATLIPRLAPANWLSHQGDGAPYWIDFDKETVTQWDEDATDCRSGVSVTYSGGTQPRTPQQNSSTFVDRFRRVRNINLQGGTMGNDLVSADAAALQRAKTYLAFHEVPAVAATLQLRQGRQMRLAAGGEKPSYLCRFGEWVQVGDQEPLFILSTKYDANTDTWQATAQNYARGLWDQLARQEAIARAVSASVNPVSGALQDTSLGLTTRYVAGTAQPAQMPGVGGMVNTDGGIYVNAGGAVQRVQFVRYLAGTGAPSGGTDGDIVVRDDGLYQRAGGTWKFSASV